MSTARPQPPLVLASASPRRRQLLADAGLAFTVAPRYVDETMGPDEPPTDMVIRLATIKAESVAPQFPDHVVLGADTIVCIDDQILGKPQDLDHAADMLRRLSGKAHRVLTGVCLARLCPAKTHAWVATTTVTFRELTDEGITAYLARVDVLDKAGAYAIQENGDLLIDSIDGLYSNVVGLPVEDVVAFLNRFFPNAVAGRHD